MLLPPAATWATELPRARTRTGPSLSVVVPSPSWPVPLAPQHQRAPSAVRAQRWKLPADIWAIETPKSITCSMRANGPGAVVQHEIRMLVECAHDGLSRHTEPAQNLGRKAVLLAEISADPYWSAFTGAGTRASYPSLCEACPIH